MNLPIRRRPKVKGYFQVYNHGQGLGICQGCQKMLEGAGKTGRVKNRHSTRFWKLSYKLVKERVLCGDCLKQYWDLMPQRKKYTFNDYTKRGYWK